MVPFSDITTLVFGIQKATWAAVVKMRVNFYSVLNKLKYLQVS